jgi:alpha-L-fucosidase
VARHSWYYNRAKGYDSADPRYVQLYGEGLAKGGMPRREAIRKWEDTLAELVDLFRPDYIFVDGGTADTYCRNGSYVMQDAFRRIVARYYNAGIEHSFEPVISFKRESLWKEEAVPDYEGGMLVGIAPYKWQTHCNTAGWFYRPGGFVTPSRVIFRKTIDVVSKNGNMLLNLGLKGDGSMQEVEVTFLRDLAAWTKVVGEGIYATRPWRVYGEEDPRKPKMIVEKRRKGIVYDDPDRVPTGRLKLSDADIRYTRSKDQAKLYATRLGWPEAPFTLRSFAEDGVGRGVKVRAVSLLGSKGTTGWRRTGTGIVITPPATPVFDDPDWPVTFRLDVESTSR